MARIDLFVLQPGLAYPPPVILQRLSDEQAKRLLGKIVDTYALNFRREFHHDSPPFSCEEDDCWNARKWRTVVLCSREGGDYETAIIGAIGFRLEKTGRHMKAGGCTGLGCIRIIVMEATSEMRMNK